MLCQSKANCNEMLIQCYPQSGRQGVDEIDEIDGIYETDEIDEIHATDEIDERDEIDASDEIVG